MTTKRENVPYTALPGTVLADVEVYRCPKCGEHEVNIPAIDDLNRLLAEEVVRKRGRLNGDEIRFLRTYLGYSGADLAKTIGSEPATISRWETNKQPIGHHADLLLRALVVLDKRIDDYALAEFQEISRETLGDPKEEKRKKGPQYAVTPASSKKWKSVELSA